MTVTLPVWTLVTNSKAVIHFVILWYTIWTAVLLSKRAMKGRISHIWAWKRQSWGDDLIQVGEGHARTCWHQAAGCHWCLTAPGFPVWSRARVAVCMEVRMFYQTSCGFAPGSPVSLYLSKTWQLVNWRLEIIHKWGGNEGGNGVHGVSSHYIQGSQGRLWNPG